MYQYSLAVYKELFQKAADDADQSSDDEVRIKNVFEMFMSKLYT